MLGQVLEASNVYWKPLYWHLYQQGAMLRTVNGVQAKRARTTGSRKNRDDLVDAKAAATVFLMGDAHKTKFPEPLWADLRELERMLIFIDKFTSGLKNRMRSSLFQSLPEFEELFAKNTVSSRSTLHLLMKGLSNPDRLKEISAVDLTKTLKEGSHGRLGYQRAVQLKELAESSFGIPRGSNARSIALRFGAQLVDFIDQKITQPLMHEIEETLEKIKEAQWLTTIDGVGKKTAAIFLGELGNPAWFQRTNQVVAWFGWDPSSSRSANYKRRISKISKAGSKYGRYCFSLKTNPYVLGHRQGSKTL
jgi:transposase